MNDRIPRPNNETLTFGQYVIQNIQDYYLWCLEHAPYLLLWTLIISLTIYAIHRLHLQQKNLQKIWNMTLFFLTKRQMLLPPIYTLAKRDALLENEKLQKLITIKQDLKDCSFKKHPLKRLKLESEISKIFFEYFNNLINQNKLQQNPAFTKILKDLEFIDGKLVELQNVYNHHCQKWNQHFSNPIKGGFYRLIRLHPFDPFE